MYCSVAGMGCPNVLTKLTSRILTGEREREIEINIDWWGTEDEIDNESNTARSLGSSNILGYQVFSIDHRKKREKGRWFEWNYCFVLFPVKKGLSLNTRIAALKR